MEFIRINNRKNFLLSEVPSINPHSRKYLLFWREQEKRCTNGFWSIDDKDVSIDIVENIPEFPQSNSWRYIPPVAYFYVNFGTIMANRKGATSGAKVPKRPNLDDVEWEFNYNWIEARGFSGFEFDTKYSCNRLLLDEDYTDTILKERCVDEDGIVMEMMYNNFFNKDGSRKEYIPARKYIRQLFNQDMGRPIYGNIPKNMMLIGTRDGGKMLHTNELIRIKDGWEEIGNLKIGDKVYGSDGLLANVINTTKIQNNLKMYKITLQDGRTIESCEDHLWKIWDKNKFRYNKKDPYKVINTKDLFKSYYTEKIDSKYFKKTNIKRKIKEFKYALPINESLKNETKLHLEIHPYIVGCLLGDGGLTTRTVSFTNTDKDVIIKLNKLLPIGYKLNKLNSKTYSIIRINKELPPFGDLCDKIGISNKGAIDKEIPNKYLFSSEVDRLDLLQGLNDTDGFADDRHIEYCTVSEKLANDYCDLTRSLGINCSMKKSKAGYKDNDGKYIQCNDRYRIAVYTDKEIFSLSRKQNRIKPKKARGRSRFEKTYIINIETVKNADGVCIMVDNNDHTYITKDYIVTHNSYLMGGGIIAHELLFDGVRQYSRSDEKKPIAEIVVGASMSDKSRDLLKKSKMTIDNLPGAWKKGTSEEIPSALFKHMAGSLGANKDWTHKYDKKIGGGWKTLEGSFVKHRVFTTENPEAAAGGRPGTIIVEEVGLLGNVISVHGGNVAAQNDGGEKFGSSMYAGTSGNIEKIIESELIFNSPEGFDMLEFDNIWEPEQNTKICWFIPATHMARRFKDENGNTKIAEAYKHFMKDRVKAGKAATKKALETMMMNYPLVPSEMFVNADLNRFPIKDLKYQYAKLMGSKKELGLSYKVEFIIKENNTIDFKNVKKNPIREYPVKAVDKDGLEGCPEIFIMPTRDHEGKVPSNIYIGSLDPIDDDDNSDITRSLQSCWIMNRLTGELCFEYTGRTNLVKEFYEQFRRALIFYNAKCNYENNKKGFYGHMMNKASTYLLVETPEILLQKGMQKSTGTGNKSLGTNMNVDAISYGLDLLEEWLISKPNEDQELMMLHTIKSPALLRELMSFSPKGNFDRISSLLVLLILREDKRRLIKKAKVKVKSALDDDFFKDTYGEEIDYNRMGY